jgi:hypothetical protein
MKKESKLIELVLNGAITFNYYVEKKREKEKEIERKIQGN